MPSKVSDIHEIAVLIGLLKKIEVNDGPEEKFKVFTLFANKYSAGKINITLEEFAKREDLFNRGVGLAKLMRKKNNFSNKTVSWSGIENHQEDSSDIYVGKTGVSLKDSSRIIRNCGFSQWLESFCPNPIKKFNDPYWEFAPNLSVQYLHTVIFDCNKRGFIRIVDSTIYINGKKRGQFDGHINDLLKASLNSLVSCIKKADIKSLIKDFSKNGNKKELFSIRQKLVSEVSNKVLVFFREGVLQNPKYVNNQIKHMLQFRKKEKLFGFSSKKFSYVGEIPKEEDVNISVGKIWSEKSKLVESMTGLQINFYTDIDISFPAHMEKITLQNQLRYKHRTFSCAPEANFHLLKYEDWKKLYPSR